MNRTSYAITLLLVALLVISGCQNRIVQEEEPAVKEPAIDNTLIEVTDEEINNGIVQEDDEIDIGEVI